MMRYESLDVLDAILLFLPLCWLHFLLQKDKIFQLIKNSFTSIAVWLTTWFLVQFQLSSTIVLELTQVYRSYLACNLIGRNCVEAHHIVCVYVFVSHTERTRTRTRLKISARIDFFDQTLQGNTLAWLLSNDWNR